MNEPAPALTTVLTATDRARLHRVLGQMPYGAGLVPQWRDVTIDSLVEVLAEMAGRLRGVAARDEQREAELAEYRELLGGGRRLLRHLLAKEDD